MSRNERLLYGADLLDETTVLPRRRRQFEGPFRRSLAGPHQQHGPDAGQRSQEVQLPAEALQPGAQGPVQERFGLLRELAQLLREEPEIGHRRDAGARLQRDVDRRRRLRSDVLRQRLQNGGEGGGRALRLHFPLVLRSQVQSLPDQENHPHLSIGTDSYRIKVTKPTTNLKGISGTYHKPLPFQLQKSEDINTQDNQPINQQPPAESDRLYTTNTANQILPPLLFFSVLELNYPIATHNFHHKRKQENSFDCCYINTMCLEKRKNEKIQLCACVCDNPTGVYSSLSFLQLSFFSFLFVFPRIILLIFTTTNYSTIISVTL